MSWLWDQPLSNRTNLCKVLDVSGPRAVQAPVTLLGLGFYAETHNLLKQQLQEYPLLMLVRSHMLEESCFVEDVKRLHIQLY
jgi:hypothetical protein